MEPTKREVKREVRKLRSIRGPARMFLRAEHMRSLPDDLRFAVARRIAGGS